MGEDLSSLIRKNIHIIYYIKRKDFKWQELHNIQEFHIIQ